MGLGLAWWLEPESFAYPWLATDRTDRASLYGKITALRTLGVPYTDDDIAHAADEVTGKTDLDALIAYLQVLGTSVK